jgi:hypothetical protein
MRTPVYDHADTLEQAWKMLLRDWQDSREVWNDKVREQFENQHWNPLELHSRSAHKAMLNLAEVIAKARQSVK